jgi:hypothetical protein
MIGGHVVRHLKNIRAIAVLATGLLAATAIMLTGSSAQAATFPEICGNQGTGYCLNDWNNAGTGGSVVMYYGGTTNDAFSLDHLTGACGNGYVTSNCPFTTASIDADLRGQPIYRLRYLNHSNLCIAASVGAFAILEGCPDNNGNGGAFGTLLVGDASPITCGGTIPGHLIDRYESDYQGTEDALQSGGNPKLYAYFTTQYSTCWGEIFQT